MKKPPLNIHSLTAIAMMVAILGILAQLTIPLGPVPFTMQTAGIFMALVLLQPRDAFFAVLVYVLLGAVGLPVFHAFQGGLGVLAGPTGGFLFGFILGIFLGGQLLRRLQGRWRNYLACLLLMVVYFGWGTIHFALIMGLSLKAAFLAAALPFIPVDLLKIALFVPLCERIRQRLHSQLPQTF